MVVLASYLQRKLQQRQQADLIRQRLSRSGPQTPSQILNGRQLLSFCSNDYLGLANHPELIAALKQGADRYGVGSGASHLVTGHCDAHQALEEELAAFTGRDKALLFSTGYMANMGVINSLMPPGSLVLQDSLNHASLLDGGWLSRADSKRFAHGDLSELESQLRQARAKDADRPILLVSDGVFSMDGDLAQLPDLVRLSKQYQAWLLIDDAHGIGCLGEQGRGVIDVFGDDQGFVSQQALPVLIGTLGKAFGCSGAFVAGDAVLIDYLTQFSRSYVFTTAMPPALAEASRAALRLVREEPWRRQRLQKLIQQFRKAVVAMGLPLAGGYRSEGSPVQAIVLGDATAAVRASALLAEQGLQISAIRPPTVPEGASRLRLTFSAEHTDAQMTRLLDAMQLLADRYRSEQK